MNTYLEVYKLMSEKQYLRTAKHFLELTKDKFTDSKSSMNPKSRKKNQNIYIYKSPHPETL